MSDQKKPSLGSKISNSNSYRDSVAGVSTLKPPKTTDTKPPANNNQSNNKLEK